ncbi:prenyltransferase/squalene oxidase repeat-containing protein [Patulibacter sp.]|uniref:prenyltransferase/squalene oxidase repeat-containing protein n=1 Tax=Patulibacter sp. TaxID=1912859 RepID=UPI002721455A|nr:prenyltransferase/squalene oxidase repeat-containing protein [Patulibacter sp.]MDO9409036.1 prenyltransferase/squalene oxidase repeat-containing protein [Patulibacter sp.]
MRLRPRFAVVAVLLALLAAPLDLVGPPAAVDAATGAATSGRDSARLDRIVRFLQDTQNDDGGYGGMPGAASDPLISAWVGIGLAAAGINPQDQKAPGSRTRSVATYLEAQGPITSGGRPPVTTEFERIGMFVNAAGMDPRSFGGRDYVRSLLERQSPSAWEPPAAAAPAGGAAPDLSAAAPPVGPGSLPTDGSSSSTARVPASTVPAGWFPHVQGGTAPGVNDTIFAIFFLAGAGGTDTKEPIARAARAVEAMQRPDGTWPAVRPGDGTSVDMTGAAIQALCAARRCGTVAVRRAMTWLKAHQQPDGGWQAGDLADERPGESNAGTTPWVVQALWATGTDPATWRRGGRDPLAFLGTLQRREGSIRWRESRDLNPTWMTAYAAPAFAGQAWPVPAPPRRAEVRREARAAAAKEAREERVASRRRVPQSGERGDAGDASTDGGVVSGGGGGRGADLFSRPQPQSRGATTGGVRDTERDQERRDGTRGRDGATGTAAASGPGDDGGVQNGERGSAEDAGGTSISGDVVQEPRGTQGTQRERAIAPGLRSARAGDAAPPWAMIGLGGLAVAVFLAGIGLERRIPRDVLS